MFMFVTGYQWLPSTSDTIFVPGLSMAESWSVTLPERVSNSYL